MDDFIQCHVSNKRTSDNIGIRTLIIAHLHASNELYIQPYVISNNHSIQYQVHSIIKQRDTQENTTINYNDSKDKNDSKRNDYSKDKNESSF